MFPLNSNMPYIKDNGERDKLGNVIGEGGGGSSDLPEYDSGDAGKALIVGNDANLEWGNIDGFSSFGVYAPYVVPGAIFKPSSNSGKYNIGIWYDAITSSSSRGFQPGDYDLNQCFIGDAARYQEFYNYLTSDVIEGLDMELLYDGKANTGTTAELLDAITDYDFLVLQGCYDNTGASQYDTTIIYNKIDLTGSYWFGVKDRNNSYSGTLTFTDATHVTLSVARRIMIYGIKSE